MPKFIMLCGISGSGKSTISYEMATDNTVILSSDDIREELFGNSGDQQNNTEVFRLMHDRTINALKNGMDVIYDATNLSSKRRTGFLDELIKRIPGLQTELHITLATPGQCLRNQQNRNRQVPNYVPYKHAKAFQLPTLQEKWDTVIIHNPFFQDINFSDLIRKCNGVEQTSRWHQETVDKHMSMVQQYAISHGFSDTVCKVAGFHDIGKPLCRSVDEEGNTHFYGHAQLGAYLWMCANVPSGMLSRDDWYKASLIEHHMDLQQNIDKDKLIAKVGIDMYNDLTQLREADEHGAVRLDELNTMSVLKFMNAFDDWESRISQPPYNITVKHDGDYVLLQYSLLNSDTSIHLVQECRGSIFKKNDDGQWQFVCRPFDKFFNYGEVNASEIDWSTARVLAKIDGSILKEFYDNGEWHLATNGTIDAFKAPVSDLGYSFGDVFNRALGMDYRELGKYLDPTYTYMFELTSPDTQLVVPYSDGVWYLTRRETATGKEEFDRPILPNVQYPKQYDMTRLEDVIEAASKMSKDEEGFVVNDAQGRRVKVKSPEYLIAAHLSNNKMVSNRNLANYLKEDKLDDFLAYCPQYSDRVQDIKDRLAIHCARLDDAWERVKQYVDGSPKDFAMLVKDSDAKGYLFKKRLDDSITAQGYLLEQHTPTLMKILGLKESQGIPNTEIDELEEDER